MKRFRQRLVIAVCFLACRSWNVIKAERCFQCRRPVTSSAVAVPPKTFEEVESSVSRNESSGNWRAFHGLGSPCLRHVQDLFRNHRHQWDCLCGNWKSVTESCDHGCFAMSYYDVFRYEALSSNTKENRAGYVRLHEAGCAKEVVHPEDVARQRELCYERMKGMFDPWSSDRSRRRAAVMDACKMCRGKLCNFLPTTTKGQGVGRTCLRCGGDKPFVQNSASADENKKPCSNATEKVWCKNDENACVTEVWISAKIGLHYKKGCATAPTGFTTAASEENCNEMSGRTVGKDGESDKLVRACFCDSNSCNNKSSYFVGYGGLEKAGSCKTASTDVAVVIAASVLLMACVGPNHRPA